MIETEFPDWFSLKCKYWINLFIAASILASEFSLTNENLNSLMVPIDIKVNGHFFFPSLCLSNPKHYKKKLVCRCALLLKCLLIKWHQKVITKQNLNFGHLLEAQFEQDLLGRNKKPWQSSPWDLWYERFVKWAETMWVVEKMFVWWIFQLRI